MSKAGIGVHSAAVHRFALVEVVIAVNDAGGISLTSTLANTCLPIASSYLGHHRRSTANTGATTVGLALERAVDDPIGVPDNRERARSDRLSTTEVMEADPPVGRTQRDGVIEQAAESASDGSVGR